MPASVVAAPAASKPSVAVSSDQASPKVAPVAMPGVEVKEMDRVRRIIADHMVMSKKVSPHVTNVVEVDVTKLETKEVTLGRNDDEYIEVTDGLEEGDVVLISNQASSLMDMMMGG